MGRSQAVGARLHDALHWLLAGWQARPDRRLGQGQR
jgi:hypothetical protein